MKEKSASRSPLCNLRVLICLVLLCTTAISAQATTITVTNTNDSDPGSLRQALADVNDGDTIDFAVNGTITLTSGELLVDKSVTISGPGSASLGVDGSNTATRVFHIGSGNTVSISGLSIINGNFRSGNGGGILNDHATLTLSDCAVNYNVADQGGGIYNDGTGGSATLTVADSSFSNNGSTGGYGGGIYNNGFNGDATLTITHSAMSQNGALFLDDHLAVGAGGGIYNWGGVVTIANSMITFNFSGLEAGGILNGGTLTIVDSTLEGNNAGGNGQGNLPGAGGGISSGGALTISNSTLSGNSAYGNDFKGPGYGGGIYNTGPVMIMNSTLSDNSAINGGAVYNSGRVGIGNTVLKAWISGENIVSSGGTVTSQGFNLSSDDGGGSLTGPGDQINTDPMLGPLQDNGGATLTHALLPGSPAINAGDPNFTPPPSYDQRDSPFVRVYNGRIDIGSFEAQPPRRATPAPRSRPTPPPRPTPR
jgi:hypothetical protein